MHRRRNDDINNLDIGLLLLVESIIVIVYIKSPMQLTCRFVARSETRHTEYSIDPYRQGYVWYGYVIEISTQYSRCTSAAITSYLH